MNRGTHEEIQRVLDGDMTVEEFDAFQQRLRTEPGMLETYVDYALLHHTLGEEFESRSIDGLAPVAWPARAWATVAWMVAAVAVAAVGVWWGLKKHPAVAAPAPAAVAKFSEDAIWRNDARIPGNELTSGATLALELGHGSLKLGSGSMVELEGPATLTAVSDREFQLSSGSAVFTIADADQALKIATPKLVINEAGGSKFGVCVPDEAHVFSGEARVQSGTALAQTLSNGDAARPILPGGDLERFPAQPDRFDEVMPVFTDVLTGPFVKSDWRMEYGNPSVIAERIDGENYTMFHPFTAGDADVILATIETGTPSNGKFHTDGWAGLSFYNKGWEQVFFGDCFGGDESWGLDIKQQRPIVIPSQPLTGSRTMTFRYERRSGLVTLHEGGLPLSKPVCSATIPPGLTFDEIRIGASSGAALAVRSLKIRVGRVPRL